MHLDINANLKHDPRWIKCRRPVVMVAVALNKDFGNGLSASAALIGTNADRALYVTPAGRFTGRTALVVGLKYTF